MLIRNVIFARLLNPTDYAIALTFGVVLSLFEYISNFGHENLMQRVTHGDNERFQATMHSVMIARGLLVGGIILAASTSISSFLKIPSETFNYSLLAFVPIINGFKHLDPQRLHRQNNYQVTAKIGVSADLASIFVALCCALIWSSYWAFYISFIFRHSIGTLLSHFWSIRPYRLAFDKNYLLELWVFGLPLILVGVLKYFGAEIDKALIARYSGLSQFTLYFITMMVAANAANIVTTGLSKIFIRRISIATRDERRNTALGNGVITLYLTLPLLLTLTIFGELFIKLVFGQQYQPIRYLIPAVITLVAIRQLSQWLNQIIIGGDNTQKILFADIIRVLALAVCIYFLVQVSDVRFFALAFALCELAYVLCLTQLLSTSIIGIKKVSGLLLSITVLSIMCFWFIYSITENATLLTKSVYASVILIVIIGLFNAFSIHCRKQTVQLIQQTSALLIKLKY